MPEETQAPNPERIENILRTSEFFRLASTRRQFLGRMLAVASGVTVGGALGTTLLNHGLKPVLASPGISYGSAAVGAERIGITFYDNALGKLSPFGVAGDVAKGTLLNQAHRHYFQAAANQETEHLKVLESLGLTFAVHKFKFPAGTFDSAPAMLAFGEKLESIFIGAYLGAIKAAAAVSDVFIAEAAAQIVGIECEHRVLIRDIAGEDPPNDRWFEGDITTPSTELGNTGTRSTVYASGDAAVTALLALGITPV